MTKARNVADLLLEIKRAGWSFRIMVEDEKGRRVGVQNIETVYDDEGDDMVVFHVDNNFSD